MKFIFFGLIYFIYVVIATCLEYKKQISAENPEQGLDFELNEAIISDTMAWQIAEDMRKSNQLLIDENRYFDIRRRCDELLSGPKRTGIPLSNGSISGTGTTCSEEVKTPVVNYSGKPKLTLVK